jgi:hypothetical protein
VITKNKIFILSIMSETDDIIEIEKMSIDQFAGSVVLILGAIGSLLLVIWQSRCACRCRIGCSEKCYIFDCERSPPKEKDEEKGLKDKDKKDKKDNKENNSVPKKDEGISSSPSSPTDELIIPEN